MKTNLIEKFYNSLKQDIRALQLSNDEGGNSEQLFTQIVTSNLSDMGETENVNLAYDIKGIGTRKQHQINAYAISDNYETIDLFVTIYKGTDEITRISSSEIETYQKRIYNFFNKCVNKDYVNEIEESSEIFQFAYTLANYQDLLENLVRVNIFILTDGEYKGEFPKNDKVNDYILLYRVVDIHYIQMISEDKSLPIELDFENFDGIKYDIPCLSTNDDNSKYSTYIAIISGDCLAKLYEHFGSRLLEQNVRSFLQFTGKINKGIRDTIRNEPEMFLAFNNGISATADYIELDETNHFITKINNLQIVNGGQTTASIYHSYKKDKLDISKIFVQVKFSIIQNTDDYSEIVSRISRYANTQNKVNNADFSANNPSLVVLERFSRNILTPITTQSNIQTYWFFERARGQYKTLRSREGRTNTLQKAFDKKYPKSQTFTKVELAKYINAFCEVYEGKKIVIGPHIVVRGNEKNYAQFIAHTLPENSKKIDNIFFEDTIAKAILFKTADKRYGIKPNSIGEMKQVVVPYTIALISKLTNNKIDLYKIWKNQSISQEFSDFIFNLMKQVNQFILDTYFGQHYIERAKKEECWELVKNNSWDIDLQIIKDDLIDENNLPKRSSNIDISEEELIRNKEVVKSIPSALWSEIGKWGKTSEYLNLTNQAVVSNIAFKLRQNRVIADDEYKKGVDILDIVAKYNEELLQEAEKYAGKWVKMDRVAITEDDKNDLILNLIKKMINFNGEKSILLTEETDLLYDLVNGVRKRDYDTNAEVVKIMQKLAKKGFEN